MKEQVIAQAALSDFVLEGALTIGPAVKLSAVTNLGFEAIGSLLVGVTLDFPAISATVDMANLAMQRLTGRIKDQIVVTPAFQAGGSVTVSITPHVK